MQTDNRHDDANSRSIQKKAFEGGKVVKSVKAGNVHAAERYEKLYQDCIDFGSHPNERSVTGSLKVTEQPGAARVEAIMLRADGVQLDSGLKFVAQCGLAALEIFQIVFGARFELLGVSTTMLELRRGL